MANLTYRQATQEAPVSTTTKNATLTLPHGPNPSKAVAFPEPITVVADGKVELPQ